jgi:hypothetical protein
VRKKTAAAKWDFFVSYTQADRAWAEWIAWQLETDGHQVLIQAWDMVPGTSWTHRMHEGVQHASRTIAVLSAAYLESVFATAEWEAAWRDDPLGEQRKLLVFRVADCDRPGCDIELPLTIDPRSRSIAIACRTVGHPELFG